MDEHHAVVEMTRRQREVLRGLLRGESAKAIAFDVGVTVDTVYWHATCVRRLVGAEDLGALMAWAYVHRLCCGYALLWPRENPIGAAA